MIQYHVYPGGKKHILTFSYDDGPVQDERLVALFNKYGVKGTFHLNGGSCSEEKAAHMRELYKGHEISCHTVQHGYMPHMPSASLVYETLRNREHLEKIAQYPVVGMSYPCGSYNADVIAALRAAGIVYSRTVVANRDFYLPDDFLAWHPTCHHRDAMPLAEHFLATLDSRWTRPLFYIWGHAHELKTEDDWAYMEKLVAMLSKNEKIWYATNIEIYRYMQAQKMLEISCDETVFYNPSSLDLWVERDNCEILMIPAGKTAVHPRA